MGDLSTSSIQVIDAKVSYKLLLGQPWLHELEIIAFTLRQCLKYYQEREMKINNNINPFTKVESHFADTRFLEKDDAPKETMPSTINSMGRSSTKNVIPLPKKDMPTHQLQKEES